MRQIMLGILIASTIVLAADQRSFDTWTGYGGGQDSSQYSSLNQINKSNVSQLEVAWTYSVGNSNALTFDPIVIDKTMYVSKTGSIVALDAATGKELWSHMGGPGARGMNYWESKDRSDRRIVFISGGYISEINALTGETLTAFGENGRVDPSANSDRRVGRPGGNPGRIYKNSIIVSLPASGAQYDSTPGDVRAFDVLTGKLLWTFHSVPRPGEFGADTWPKEMLPTAGGVHNWNELTVDEPNGIVFVPFGTARYDFYGGNRHGQNLFANSLVALDANTGKRIWHFQMVHHDLWDYDLPAAPKLLTVRNNGQNVDIVAQPTKFGFLYVFNRKTGVPLWPINEKPVPKSDVPGEEAWPTQPIPTKPPAFARQSFTEKDINPYLPEAERESVLAAFRSYRNEGLFTPPSLKGTIEMPGHNGGSNWGRSAVDPAKGLMYIVSSEQPTLMTLVEPGGARGRGTSRPDCGTGPYAGAPRGGGAPRGAGAAPAVPGAAGAPAAAGAAPAIGAATPPAAPGGGGANARGGAGARAGAARTPAPDTSNIPDFIHFSSPVTFMNSACNGMELIGPPWSQLTAYDLNEGSIKWQVPHGEVPALARMGKTGLGSQAPRGGVVVTAGGLVFSGTSSDRKFRAYDQDTGKVLWAVDMPAASEGIPAVYQVDGREFIVVPTGGNGYLTQPNLVTDPPIPAPGPSAYVVFALRR